MPPPSTPTYRAPETPARSQPHVPADFGPEVGSEPSSAATTRYQTPPGTPGPATPARPQSQVPADFGPEVGSGPSSAATTRYQTPHATPGSAVTPASVTPRLIPPGSATRGSGAPGAGTPGGTTPGPGTPGWTTPGSATSGSATPGSVTPRPVTPDSTAGGSSTLGPAATSAGTERDQWWATPAADYNLDDDDDPVTPARRSGSGLSWADDPIAQRLAPRAPVAEPDAPSAKGRWLALGLAGALAVVIGLVATIIALNRDPGGDDDGKVTAAPPPTTTAALSCPALADGRVTVGNGAGNTGSGPGAILGFQHAFYVERSGEKARTFVAPDSENISPVETIQKAINEEIPAGTTHCLRITEVTPETFDVDLTEHRPNGVTNVYPQVVTVVNRDGKILIHAINRRD
ncbi:hypothetical protein GCM10027088_57270 [Nocardia goodfellowii]